MFYFNSFNLQSLYVVCVSVDRQVVFCRIIKFINFQKFFVFIMFIQVVDKFVGFWIEEIISVLVLEGLVRRCQNWKRRNIIFSVGYYFYS